MTEQQSPKAIARPGIVIEIATPQGNQLLPVEVARDLRDQLTQALAGIDAQFAPQPEIETAEQIELPIQDDQAAQVSGD
jgi:hypothetical protein